MRSVTADGSRFRNASTYDMMNGAVYRECGFSAVSAA